MSETPRRELLQLSSLLGAMIGRVISDVGVNKLAVVSRRDSFEISLASATISSFLSASPSLGEIFFPSDIEELISFDPHLTFFSSLSLPGLPFPRLQEAGFSSDVLLFDSILSSVGKDPFWTSRDVFVLSIDEEKGRLILSKHSETELDPLFEYPLSCNVVNLLRRVNPFKKDPSI